jgi:hypothetical protein
MWTREARGAGIPVARSVAARPTVAEHPPPASPRSPPVRWGGRPRARSEAPAESCTQVGRGHRTAEMHGPVAMTASGGIQTARPLASQDRGRPEHRRANGVRVGGGLALSPQRGDRGEKQRRPSGWDVTRPSRVGERLEAGDRRGGRGPQAEPCGPERGSERRRRKAEPREAERPGEAEREGFHAGGPGGSRSRTRGRVIPQAAPAWPMKPASRPCSLRSWLRQP